MIRQLGCLGLEMILVAGLNDLPSSVRGGREDRQLLDHADYAVVLQTYVNDVGLVDYRRLKADSGRLLSYRADVAGLPRNHYEEWDRDAKIAFWLNAYNGLTLQVIIGHYPIKASFLRSLVYPSNSIRQIDGAWDKIEFKVMGRKLTLGRIEHEILRKEFHEPRIHMALVCAAIGCPPLRDEPYVGERLDEQLNDQTRRFLGNREKFRIDRKRGIVYLSSIFKSFAGDFVKSYVPSENIGRYDTATSAVLNFVASYLEEADRNYLLAGKYRVKYLDYDWSLNEQKPETSRAGGRTDER